MTREELAARIFASNYIKPSARDMGWHVTPKQAFKAADHFLAYAEKHREPKAVECEHEWTWPNKNFESQCQKCGAPKVQPEPPKPERKAREFILAIGDNGETLCVGANFMTATKEKAKKWEYVVAREVLPEGDT